MDIRVLILTVNMSGENEEGVGFKEQDPGAGEMTQ